MKQLLIGILGCVLLMMASAITASAQTTRDVRTVKDGDWTDPAVWERWNGSNWAPLLPRQYPGSRSLKQVHVHIDHQVKLPERFELHVAEVTAINRPLEINGSLIVDIAQEYVDSSWFNEVSAVTGEPVRAESGVKLSIAPNPVYTGSMKTVTVSYVLDKSYNQVVLGMYNEAGQLVYTISEESQVSAGEHSTQFDVGDFPSGNFRLVIKADGTRKSQPLQLVR